jgi:hypothetical protein
MKKRLSNYLHYYIGQKVKVYDPNVNPNGKIMILKPNIIQDHLDYPNEIRIELYLKPSGEITREHVRQLIDYTPEDFGDTVHWYIKRGYDVFGLIKAGLAKHKNTLYE